MRSWILGLALAVICFSGADAAVTCDRTCLTGITNSYLAALVARDPAKAPIAANAKFTENGALIKIGEGLWYGAGPSKWDLAILAVDSVSGQIGYLGALSENDLPIVLILRLKVVDGKITEIEHRVERGLAPYTVAALKTADVFKQPVAPSERSSREAMTRIANSYFDAIEQANSKLAPFAKNCERYESAERTTHNQMAPERLARMSEHDKTFWTEYRKLGCGGQIDTNALRHINALNPRRILVFDEEAGMAFSLPTFIHKGDIQTVEIKNVKGITSLTLPTPPGDSLAGEVFKIRRGQIEGVQVSGCHVPYGTKMGWE